MRRSFPPQAHHHDNFSENRQPEDYYGYVAKLEKSTSSFGDAEPPFKNNIHMIFKQKPTYEEHHHPKREAHVKFVGEPDNRREEYFVKTEERALVKEGHGHEVVRKIYKEEEEDIDAAATEFVMREKAHVKEGHVHDVARKIYREEEEDINTAAGDFIVQKHKVYEMQKQMSMNAQR